MYFSLLRKKEIILNADCTAQKLTDSINENIENRGKGFLAKEPEKVFCGEFHDGKFLLGLNDFYSRFYDFSRFLCSVTGDECKSQIKLVFVNEVYKPKAFLLNLILGLFFAFIIPDYKFFVFIFPMILTFIGSLISFNLKMNRCIEEIEYIINQILLGKK